MDNKNLLDKIVLSNTAVSDFHNTYESNDDFRYWLLNLMPEIDDCIRQQQNTPWHKYNVMDHILHSVEEMNAQTKNLPESDKRMLAYTMFLHDIGKPACHSTRMKDGRLVDSFFNHNIVSEKVAKRVLPELGFNAKDIKVIAKLVYKHDIFISIKLDNTSSSHHRQLTDKLIDEEIKDLNQVGDGEKLMRYLVMIGKSDTRAQNEKMTANSIKLLEKFDEMLDNRNEMSK